MPKKKVLTPNFSHIQKLYHIELDKRPKMGHKLTEKVLHPKVIEKSNVKLADSLFHESTMNALMYYAGNGCPQFEDSAIFIKYIQDWFNQVNVKSTDYGIRAKDERQKPIRRESWHG